MSEKACYVFKAKSVAAETSEFSESEQEFRPFAARQHLFETLWHPIQKQINHITDAANDKVLSEIRKFIFDCSGSEDGETIPTALLVTSASPSFHLFDQLQDQITQEIGYIYVSVTSAEAPNLKTLLKNVIAKSTKQHNTMALDGESDDSMRAGPKLLSYDFEILYKFCQNHQIQRVIITLQNSESFDTAVLADFIQFIQIWLERVPVLLLFDIATSASALQDRLPTTVVRCLRGQPFDAAKTEQVIEAVFEAVCADAKLYFGPAVTMFIFQRIKDYTQNLESFVQSLKYACMCHIYGSLATSLLDTSFIPSELESDLCEAIRHFPSFRSYAEDLLSHKEAAKVRMLLEDNGNLLHAVDRCMRQGCDNMTWLVGAIKMLQAVKYHTSAKAVPSFSKLYVSALSGELSESAIVREAILSIKKATPQSLLELLTTIYDKLMSMPASDIEVSPDDFGDILADLKKLYPTEEACQIKPSLTSAASKQKPSKHAADHASLVQRFHDLLNTYFTACFVPMSSIYFHEILFCDSRGLLQNALTPKPRASIERALSSPHDYLGCTCCKGSEGPIGSHPYTAVLYQLFMESGTLVNVFDLWTAFSEVIGDQDENEQLNMALFFRSLAELKYLGLLKPSRKRVDHLGKILWKGL